MTCLKNLPEHLQGAAKFFAKGRSHMREGFLAKGLYDNRFRKTRGNRYRENAYFEHGRVAFNGPGDHKNRVFLFFFAHG